MKRLALIVGHSGTRRGANNYLGESEYTFNSRIGKKVVELCNDEYQSLLEVKGFKRFGGPYKDLCPSIKLFKPDVTLELHFNAFSGKAYGVEMLVYKDGPRAHDNAIMADIFTDLFAEEYGVRERHTHRLDDNSETDGVKYMSEGRGVHNLKTMHDDCGVPFAMLFEPVFANFETSESKAVFEDEDRYINFLVKAIGEIKELL